MLTGLHCVVLHWLVVDVVFLLVLVPPLRELVAFVLLPQLTGEFLAPFQGVLRDLGLEETGTGLLLQLSGKFLCKEFNA